MTEDTKPTDPKTRILDAAIELFAQKGYSATGMRELARRADVNLAMINYHFGSKQKLLEAVFDVFFERHSNAVQTVLQLDGTPEQRIRSAIRRLITLFRERPDLVRVAFAELPFDVPEFADYKANRIKTMLGRLLGEVLPLAAAQSPREFVPEMMAPALMGMIVFHFLMRPVLQGLFETAFDDSFYDAYPDRIADLFLFGILGHPTPVPPAATEPLE